VDNTGNGKAASPPAIQTLNTQQAWLRAGKAQVTLHG